MININSFIPRVVDNHYNVLSTKALEESYFDTTLSYLSEMNREIMSNKKNLYLAIHEASELEVINESFGEFFTKVKEIIERFIKFLKSLVDRFITAFMKTIKSASHLEKQRELFSDLSESFDFSMYVYTFSPNIPQTKALAYFNRDFISLDISDIDTKDNKAIKDRVVKTLSKIEKLDDMLDIFRGEVISKGAISKDDYAGELRRLYRNNEDDKDDVSVHSYTLEDAYSRYKDYNKSVKSVKDTMKTLEKEYNAVKKEVENMVKKGEASTIADMMHINYHNYGEEANPIELSVDADVMIEMNKFIKAKVDQINQMSTIHAMAFSAKLDAYRDCYNQDIKLMYKGLSEIHKQKGRGEKK